MSDIIIFSEIVEANGKTIRENNMDISHKWNVGDWVVYRPNDDDNGGFSLPKNTIGRIISLDRDCDGTPLVSFACEAAYKEWRKNPLLLNDIIWRMYNWISFGHMEESFISFEQWRTEMMSGG